MKTRSNSDVHPEPDARSESGDIPDEQLQALLLESIAPLPLSRQTREMPMQRLMQRVRHSQAAHAGLMTIRARDGQWRTLIPGIQVKVLWEGREGSSLLLRLEPGARLPPHQHRWLEEGVVLNGRCELEGQSFGPGDYHVCRPGSAHEEISSEGGALVFLRGANLGPSLPVAPHALPYAPYAPNPDVQTSQPLTLTAPEQRWESLAPGIDTTVLLHERGRISRFVRVQPGASLGGHGHAEEEECMMLSGQAFFGDVLVQAGDFHIAPAGTVHHSLESEWGALMFVSMRDEPYVPSAAGH